MMAVSIDITFCFRRISCQNLKMIPALAEADGGIYRDRSGGYAGSWEGNDVERIYKDSAGGYLGSAERSGSGWTFKDRAGVYAGSSSGPSDRVMYPPSDDNDDDDN